MKKPVPSHLLIRLKLQQEQNWSPKCGRCSGWLSDRIIDFLLWTSRLVEFTNFDHLLFTSGWEKMRDCTYTLKEMHDSHALELWEVERGWLYLCTRLEVKINHQCRRVSPGKVRQDKSPGRGKLKVGVSNWCLVRKRPACQSWRTMGLPRAGSQPGLLLYSTPCVYLLWLSSSKHLSTKYFMLSPIRTHGYTNYAFSIESFHGRQSYKQHNNIQS